MFFVPISYVRYLDVAFVKAVFRNVKRTTNVLTKLYIPKSSTPRIRNITLDVYKVTRRTKIILINRYIVFLATRCVRESVTEVFCVSKALLL